MPKKIIIAKKTKSCFSLSALSKNEDKYFTKRTERRLNRFFDKHPIKRICCNTSFGEDELCINNFFCSACIKYKAMQLTKKTEEQKKIINTLKKLNGSKSMKRFRKHIQLKFSRDGDGATKKKNESKNLRKGVIQIDKTENVSLGKRPQLRKNSFEFPHIIYCISSNNNYYSQDIHPQEVARQYFHARHPRFIIYENKEPVNDFESQPEQEYCKLLRMRYKKEIEMINNFLQYPILFQNHIPSETCIMVLNVNCKEDRNLYVDCLYFMNNKNEILTENNFNNYIVPTQLQREINLDNDLTPQKLYSFENSNKLQMQNEELKCLNEKDFPDIWYTQEKECDIEEERDRLYSKKIKEQYSTPVIEDNRMNVEYDYALEREAYILQEQREDYFYLNEEEEFYDEEDQKEFYEEEGDEEEEEILDNYSKYEQSVINNDILASIVKSSGLKINTFEQINETHNTEKNEDILEKERKALDNLIYQMNEKSERQPSVETIINIHPQNTPSSSEQNVLNINSTFHNNNFIQSNNSFHQNFHIQPDLKKSIPSSKNKRSKVSPKCVPTQFIDDCSSDTRF